MPQSAFEMFYAYRPIYFEENLPLLVFLDYLSTGNKIFICSFFVSETACHQKLTINQL